VLASHPVLRAAGADFGKVPTKKQTVFGYKRHLLVILGGVVRDCALASASASDVAVGGELLRKQMALTVVGDKAYISAPLADELRAEHSVPCRPCRAATSGGSCRRRWHACSTARGRSSRPPTTS